MRTILLFLLVSYLMFNSCCLFANIIDNTFEQHELGLYSKYKILLDWNGSDWIQGTNRMEIVEYPMRNKCLKISYPRDKFGSKESGGQWRFKLNKSYENLYLSFNVFFPKGFNFVKGGKLPGLAGGETKFASSGNKPNGLNAWSARIMWRQGGGLVQYVYHRDQPESYGEDFKWNEYIVPGKWHFIENRVKLNDPGKKNGILQAWLDGELVLDINRFYYRDNDSLSIDQFIFCTFFGGRDKTWSPDKYWYIYIDNIMISEDRTDNVYLNPSVAPKQKHLKQ